MTEKKKIKKPWCIYRFGSPSGVGRIEGELADVAWVRYSEGQPLVPWKKECLWRFDTVFEAIVKIKKNEDLLILLIVKKVARDFPSATEEIWKAYEKYEKKTAH